MLSKSLVLDFMQQDNFIPTPPLATAVTTILLTSAFAAKYNNMTGRVVEAPKRALACAPKNSEIQVNRLACMHIIQQYRCSLLIFLDLNLIMYMHANDAMPCKNYNSIESALVWFTKKHQYCAHNSSCASIIYFRIIQIMSALTQPTGS